MLLLRSLVVAGLALSATLAVVANDEAQQAPLLPEGSFIASARGTMERPGPSKPWTFRIQTAEEGHAQQELVLLPTTLVEEMEQNQAAGEDAIHFTVSGPVLLYRGRNFLLPQHVEMETSHAARPGTASDEPMQATDPPPAEDTPEPPPVDPDELIEDDFDPIDQGDSIASIVAQLQQDVGPLKRSVAATSPLIEVPQGVSEGELLISRRGRILRDRGGAWVIVPDADASGLRDPSMILLPSSNLVSIENWARKGGMGKPILFSGEVFSYRGRHFLLPTSWRIPRERPNLK
ncbi:MAG: hypothetical protein MK085_13365 [Phycisphaerales bacterium]|nr:hypothetical protein [Phycisphaerales bacterium]